MNVIITGATGMVGKGVLLECLQNDDVKSITVVGRRSVGLQDPKLKEIIHQDMHNLSTIADQLIGFDACFFCIGVSSFRMPEAKYLKITHDLTLNVARELLNHNKNMSFHYVSAAGADSSEQNSTQWKRVKGKTENDLGQLGFKDFYAYRPAYIKPDKKTPSRTKSYNCIFPILSVLHPVIVGLFPKYSTTSFNIGRAMIHNTNNGYNKKVLKSVEINQASKSL